MAVLLMSITVATGWAVVGGLSFVFVLLFLLAGVFGPMPQYTISSRVDISDNDSEMFLNVLESLTDAKINRAGTLEVLTNGPCFYPAALDAMRSAQQSICHEAYIFQRSEIGRLYLEVMTERARAGVQVNVVLDAFGSMGANKAFFKPLLDAGGRMELYNKPRWYSLARVDKRTHRELLIVDGRVGFIGAPVSPNSGLKAPRRTHAGATPWFASKATRCQVCWRLLQRTGLPATANDSRGRATSRPFTAPKRQWQW